MVADTTTSTTTPAATTATHYERLGVAATASYQEIKQAFFTKARQVHPDKQQPNKDDDDFRLLQTAWEILRETECRQRYDEELEQRRLQQQSKIQGAIGLCREDLEQAVDVDEDDGDDETFLYIYNCRCGQEVILEDDNDALVDCRGCCFVYRLQEESITKE